ncbi:MAG: transglutaminase family protein [Rhodospirillales bacterium]|nr:transglutaminase family protein [Rhodospirillales bacterium]MDP6645908.1 transglutaminase family protein [Rhodospirillales bacterium]MDP6840765.1 transglutaminase family protein [Rhodospirillales bacterium]
MDSDHPRVVEFADAHVKGNNDLDRVISLYYAVRDEILYDPYLPVGKIESYRASDAVATGRGWCVPKSALLTACCRINGVPARPGYADVRNHLATPRLLELLGTDIFPWHSYTEILIDGLWVKATPAFNRRLCDRFGLKPLEFDGSEDSLFHEFDQKGQRHMEYIRDRGAFLDVPFDEILATFKTMYRPEYISGAGGDFHAEAAAEKQ